MPPAPLSPERVARHRQRTRARRRCAPRGGVSLLAAAVLSAALLPVACAEIPAEAGASALGPPFPESIESLHVRGLQNDSARGGAITNELRRRDRADVAFFQLVQVLEDAVRENNCFLNDQSWVGAVEKYANSRGWQAPSGACNSATTARRMPLNFSPPDTFQRLSVVADHLNAIKTAVIAATVANFSDPVMPRAFPFPRGTSIKQECTVERNTALRVQEEGKPTRWYLLSGITNGNVTVDKEAWNRQYVTEYVGMDMGTRKFVAPLWQNVVPYGRGNERKNRTRAATVAEQWAGRVGLSGVFSMGVEEAPALQAAVERMDVDVDQATDAVTPSNTAILALPMAINLIPVSLLADVSTFGLLFYTLLTDVLTTVPFIIKGFELISMGNRRYIDHAGWFRGKNNDPFLLLEFWAADCRILKVRKIGIIFVVVGFSAMVVGIITELLARRLRRKWTEDGTLEQSAFQHVKVALLGAESSHNKARAKGEIFFDPNDEEAAFAAQQAATRGGLSFRGS